MGLKAFLRGWCPPIILRLIQPKKIQHVNFSVECASWSEAKLRCSGYDSDLIVDKVLNSTRSVMSGVYAYERDSVCFSKIEYSWPVLCGLLLAASLNKNSLSIMDFGGSLGTSYFQNKKFISSLSCIKWGVVEQSIFVEVGNREIKNGELFFYNSVEECALELKPNVVLFSSVLQYLEDYLQVINQVVKIGAEFIIIDRTPMLLDETKERILIQNVPDCIYKATYPCRFFVENDLINVFRLNGYLLFESFLSLDALDERAEWRGYIFRRASLSFRGYDI